MKNIFYVLVFFATNAFSQGKYAGEFSSILGAKYTTEKEIPLLTGFVYRQGIMLSDSDGGPYVLNLNVFKKGKISLVILEKLVDLEKKTHAIIEVLKIVDVPQNYEIRLSNCTSKSVKPEDTIVAVYYIGRSKKVKSIKESYVLKDIRFEKLNPKLVKCINEI